LTAQDRADLEIIRDQIALALLDLDEIHSASRKRRRSSSRRPRIWFPRRTSGPPSPRKKTREISP
jgi:hypothetical protein